MKKNLSKKIKFGSVAVMLTAAFIAVAVLLNAVLTILNKNGKLDIDMTSNSIYTISEASEKILDSNDTPVTVYFLQERDKASEDANGLAYMLNLVDSYAARFPWIDVQYLDIEKRVDFKNKYTKSQNDVLANNSLVVDCEDTGEYKVLTASDYFLLETQYYYQTVTGFQGELALTSAILNVTTPDGLVACFDTGHGESVSAPLEELLDNAGYSVIKQNLSEEDINADVSLLIINNPTLDFVGKVEDTGIKSEVDKLVDYLNLPEKNMLVYMSPSTPALPSFEEFLAMFGVSVKRCIVYDTANAYTGTEGMGIYGTFNAPAETVASEIAERVKDGYSSIFYKSAPIDILFDSKNHITVSPIVTTTKTAYYEEEEGVKTGGQTNLLTVSTKTLSGGASNLVVCSTANYNAFLTESKYGNRELMYSVLQSFGATNVTPDISPKVFDNTNLNVSETAARIWGIVITFVPAAIILAVGLVIWNKRRHL